MDFWEGTDFDCNGTFSMASSCLGALNDSILVILPMIDSIENAWEKMGDDSRPFYFGYPPSLALRNGNIEGYVSSQPYLDPILNEMP